MAKSKSAWRLTAAASRAGIGYQRCGGQTNLKLEESFYLAIHEVEAEASAFVELCGLIDWDSQHPEHVGEYNRLEESICAAWARIYGADLPSDVTVCPR